jgi:hypothetical protein
MPKDFGFVSQAPWSRDVFAPSDTALLTDAPWPPTRLATAPLFGALAAAAVGGLTLIEPRALGGGARAAYRIATAAITGTYTAATLPLDAPLDAGQRGSIGVATGGTTLGLAEPLEALDARMVDWLVARGVRRPRWWLAGVGAAIVAAGWAADRAELRSLQRALREGADHLDDEPPLGPVDPAVRAILDALLRPDVPGAEALRIQLESVQQRNPGVPDGLPADALDGLFHTDAYLAVDEDAPRISPRTQLWPVTGRFTRDGAVFEVELQIHEGRLESLSLMVADETYGPDSDMDHEEAIGLLTAWPEVEELEIRTEMADPLP